MTDPHGVTETASHAARAAAQLDADLLMELVQALKPTTDAREARRVIDRRCSGRTAQLVYEIFDAAEHRVALAAMEAAVQTATAIREQLGETTVVWSGPTVRTLPVRPTRQVVMELIGRARESLTLVTYASHGIDDLVAALDDARLERDVAVRLIVETKEDSKDGIGPDSIAAFGNLPRAVPVYRWPAASRGAHGGSMHVKTVVQDRHAILISSANLTSAAMDRNMELGLLIEGGPVPGLVDQHFDELIEVDQLVRWSR